jgi:Kef-type K+ transport system membrane component KefB
MLIFSAVFTAGSIIMSYWGAFYLGKPNRTAQGFAIVLSTGIALTFAASMLAAFLASGGLSVTRAVVTFGVSTLNGLIAYGATRLLWRQQ